MADDNITLRFPPLSAILGDSAGQSEPTDEPEIPKKHIRKQSRETKKTPFPPRKAPTLEEPKDANAVKPKQTKSRNGISTHTHTPATHAPTLSLCCYYQFRFYQLHSNPRPQRHSQPHYIQPPDGIADMICEQDV